VMTTRLAPMTDTTYASGSESEGQRETWLRGACLEGINSSV